MVRFAAPRLSREKALRLGRSAVVEGFPWRPGMRHPPIANWRSAARRVIDVDASGKVTWTEAKAESPPDLSDLATAQILEAWVDVRAREEGANMVTLRRWGDDSWSVAGASVAFTINCRQHLFACESMPEACVNALKALNAERFIRARGYACPGPDCPYCSGSSCRAVVLGELAGVRLKSPCSPPCEHDTQERHGEMPIDDDLREQGVAGGHIGGIDG